MDRKQKIIISIVGISIVSLALIGLTYGYYLTRIQGNTNNKSVDLTTANLELVYGDGTTEILQSDTMLVPSDKEIGSKNFTVTNKGNDTSYVVVIENVKVTKASDGSTTTFESNDFRYTLICTKSDGTNCDGVTTQSVFPISGGILVGNSIKEGDVHTYTFKMWYIDTGVDQSNDMGKTLQARLNITNVSQMSNPYSSSKNSLAYNIIENAKNKTNGTELLSSPLTSVANEVAKTKGKKVASAEDGFWGWDDVKYGDTIEQASYNGETVTGDSDLEKCNSVIGKHIYFEINSNHAWYNYIGYVESCTNDGIPVISGDHIIPEKTLSITSDDYGASYYYRGDVEDNYVNFAGMCWRIVRIAGDGSIKLILEDQDNTCATSDGNWDIPTETGGTVKDKGHFGFTKYATGELTTSDGSARNTYTIRKSDYLNGETLNTLSMAYAFKNFQTGPLKNYLSYLKAGDWCLDDIAYLDTENATPLSKTETLDYIIKDTYLYYDSYKRLTSKSKNPTLNCIGTNMNKFGDNVTDMYVGTLTVDEVAYAGAKPGNYQKIDTSNTSYYLINDYFLSDLSMNVSLLSLSYHINSADMQDLIYSIYIGGTLTPDSFATPRNDFETKGYYSFRPAINLKSGIRITGGDGTKTNAYTITGQLTDNLN